MAVDPRGLAIERWSALTAAALAPYGDVPRQTDEQNWTGWAEAVKAVPVISGHHVPSPRGYDDWRLWAFRLNETLRNIGL